MKDFTLEIRSQGPNSKPVVLERDIPEGESSGFPKKENYEGKKANRYAENAPGWISVVKIYQKVKFRENQNADVPKHRLGRLVQNATDFVFKILRGHYSRRKNLEIRTQGNKNKMLPRGFRRSDQFFPLYTAISPQAPATLELRSNAFQSLYILFLLGRVPTSSSTQTFG